MDVSAAGPKPPDIASLAGIDARTPKPAPFAGPAAQHLTGDQVASLLQLLATPSLSSLVTGGTQKPADVSGIIAVAATAAANGDVTTALAKIREMVVLDPAQADSISRHPSFSSIRSEIGDLLRPVTAEARWRAEEILTAAEHLMMQHGPRRLPSSDVDLASVHAAAMQLFDAGRLVDYLRAAELAQVVIATYEGPRVGLLRAGLGGEPARTRDTNPMLVRIKALWSRAPLLVLLLGWLAIGLVCGLAGLVLPEFEGDGWRAVTAACWSIWALGFLALTGFGFYMRIRNIGR